MLQKTIDLKDSIFYFFSVKNHQTHKLYYRVNAMKKYKILLYVSSLLIFIHLVGHYIGHRSWKMPTDSNMQSAVNAMIENKTNYMGAHRSLADFYHGYSLILFVVYILSIWVLLILADSRSRDIRLAKRILLPFGIAYTLFGVIEFFQFFPFAAIVSTLAGFSILTAVFIMEKS